MAYNAETARRNREAAAAEQKEIPKEPTMPEATVEKADRGFDMQQFAAMLVQAIRDATQPEAPPKIEVVTVGTPTSDPKLERLIFCVDCLDRRTGPQWGTHNNVRIIEDPERPGYPKPVPVPHVNPHVPKAISYDLQAVKRRLESEPESITQCLQCGGRLAA